jgi:hypothetical protein
LSPALAAYAYAAIIAAGFGYLLMQLPVQVYDSIGNIAAAFTTSWNELLVETIGSTAFLRPFINPQTKAVLDLAPGHEFLAFRVIHVLQACAAFWLFVRVLRVRTWPAAAAAAIGVVVMAGSHTFATLVNEGYPINNYLTVALCVLVAANVVSEERSRWWTDALVAAAFLLATGTVETGLLVWVVVAAGALAGYRGVSRGGVAGLTLLVAGYFVLRFVVMDVGTPGLLERPSGFLFERLEPAQLAERFGANPYPLYAYNVVSALGTVLFSDPRSGTFLIGRAVLHDSLRPWMVVNVLSSVAATVLVLWYAARGTWFQDPSRWSGGQRLLFLAAGVIAANAAISFPYLKDQVMSTAGIFMGLAAAVAANGLIAAPPRSLIGRVAALLLIVVVTVIWSWRVIGVQHLVAHAAVNHRNDWAAIDTAAVAEREGGGADLAALLASIRATAINRVPAYPHVREPEFVEEWIEH